MRTEIQKWDYQSQFIRTKVDVDEQIWFAGIDVCNILGYANSYQTIMGLDEDERKLDYMVDSQGQRRETWTINEFGLYSLILTSTKPEAKSFKRWVTHDVLPAIRRAGLYTTEEAQGKEFELQRIAKSIEEKERVITDAKSVLKTLTSEREDLYIELKDAIRRNPNQFKIELMY